MTGAATMNRLRAANPARPEPLEAGPLLAEIVAAPRDEPAGRSRHVARKWRFVLAVSLLLLLLSGAATATYLLVRANGRIALGSDYGLRLVNSNGVGLRTAAGCAAAGSRCAVGQPAWAPTGGRIAFVRGPVGGPSTSGRLSLYVASSGGRRVRRLAGCGGCGGQWGARLGWSPDGRWIAFSRDDGATGRESIWVVAAAGGRPHRLTDCRPAWCADIAPGWSPNGRLLVFQRIAPVGSNSLYTVRPDGTHLRRIDSGADPHWSPDSTRIAFDGTGGIVVAAADGSHRRLLAPGGGGTGPGAPSWSPDGSRLAFFRTPGRPGHYRAEVWTMNSDGSEKKRLYRSGCCVMRWDAPVWSPDGRMIAFSADSAGGTFVMNGDGSDLHRISRATPYGLSWQRVSRN